MYHVSCEPLRIFWNDDTTCSTRVPRVLSTKGWKARNPALSRQHVWHSCRADCIVFSENPQGLATHMVYIHAHGCEWNYKAFLRKEAGLKSRSVSLDLIQFLIRTSWAPLPAKWKPPHLDLSIQKVFHKLKDFFLFTANYLSFESSLWASKGEFSSIKGKGFRL